MLNDMADGAGISATVVSADGTWSGATGKADGVRDVTVDDQFAIASVTKSVVAAQWMQMVEAGELGLDDPAADHLPRTSASTPTAPRSASCWDTAAASRALTRRSLMLRSKRARQQIGNGSGRGPESR